MLTNSQKDLLASIIIGDGYIGKQGKYKSYCISFGHGAQQKDYCEWKLNLINKADIFDKEMLMHSKIITHSNGKRFIQYCAKKCDYCLKYFYDRIIVNERKTVYNLLPMMTTKRSVAIWFMDDGGVEEGHWKDKNGKKHITRPNIKLCTHCFSYEEHLFIQKWFKKKFGLDCFIKQEKKKDKVYYYLRFRADDTEKLFQEILRPYVMCCSSMKHKFRHCIEIYK